MPSDEIIVRVPATSANLGPGFDCLGLALNLTGELVFTVSPISPKTPTDPVSAMAATSFRSAFTDQSAISSGINKTPPPINVTYDGAVPVGRGLGASALARVAGLLAANVLLQKPLPTEHLLNLASRLEGHADNAAPALLGGLQVVVRHGDDLNHINVPLPSDLKVVLFIPDFSMPTEESRRSLPETISREDAVHNISNTALLIASLATGKLDLLSIASRDRLHQPTRANFFPAMNDLLKTACEAGGLCAYLSGGGSTICALATDNEEAIATAMVETATHQGISGESIITTPTDQGGEVVSVS